MVSSPWKLLFEAHSHEFLTQYAKKGFWQPRGTPGEGRRHEKWKEGRAIYRESSPQTLWQSNGRLVTLAYVWWSLHIGLKGVSYIQVLPKGYPKK
jgi:hypothetical protein